MSKAKEEFGIDCHDGGSFYVCENNATEFIGCCASDPCGNSNGTCADEDLRRTTFVKSIDQYVPAQDCNDSQGSDNWYTCASGNSFMGCCSQDPCGRDDCPAGRLVPAKLSSDDVLRHKFLFPDMSSLPNAASSATVSSSSKPDHNSAGLGTGTIAGIVVCAWVGCSLMAIIAMWLLWRKPRQKKQTNVGKSNKMSASSQPYDRLDDWHQDTLETQSPAGLNQQALLAPSSLSSHYSKSIPLVEYAQNRDQYPHTNQIGNSQSHAQYTDTSSTSSQTDNSKQ